MGQSRNLDIESWLENEARLRRLAFSLAADPGLAEDALQEAWLLASRSAPRSEAKTSPWLRRIVRNAVFSQARSDQRRRGREERARPPAPSDTPDEVVARGEFRRMLMDEVLRLPEPYRTTVLLRYSEDHTSKEIAAAIGVPASTVRGRLQTGLDKLRERLARAHPDSWRDLCAAVALPAGIGAPTGSAHAATADTAQSLSGAAWGALSLVGVAALAVLLWPKTPAESDFANTFAEASPEVGSAPVEETGSEDFDSGLTREVIPGQEPEPPAPVARFRGRVVAAESGAPLAGVEIWAESRPTNLMLHTTRLRDDWEPSSPVLSDDQGRFQMDLAPAPESWLSVYFRAPGRVLAHTPYGGVVGDVIQEFGEVALHAGVEVGGVVMKSDGTPAEGAVVRIHGVKGTRAMSPQLESAVEGRAGAEGRFLLESRVPPGSYVATIDAPGCLDQRISELEVTAGDDVEFQWTCTVAPSVAGRLLDEEGRAVEGARVSLFDAQDQYLAFAWTDAEGRFRIYAPETDRTGHHLEAAEAVTDATLEGPFAWGSEDLLIQGQRTRSLRIQVRDAADGGPVEEYAVICHPATDRDNPFARAPLQGPRNFGEHRGGQTTIEGIGTGPHALLVIPTDGLHLASDWVEFDGDAQLTEPLVVEVTPTVPVVLSVTLEESGEPVVGSWVVLTSESLEPYPQYRPSEFSGRFSAWKWSSKPLPLLLSDGSTDKNGRVELRFPRDGRGGLLVLGRDHPPLRTSFAMPTEESEVVEIVIPSQARVAGTLQHPRTADGSVEIVFDNTAQSGARRVPSSQVIRASADGTFSAPLPPGEYAVRLRYRQKVGGGEFSGLALIDLPQDFGTITVGATGLTECDIDARILADGTIKGTLSVDGNPLAEQRFRLSHRFAGQEGDRLLPVGNFKTDAEGGFHFEQAPPGEYRVLVNLPAEEGHEDKRLDSGWTLILAPGAEAAWTVELSDE